MIFTTENHQVRIKDAVDCVGLEQSGLWVFMNGYL